MLIDMNKIVNIQISKIFGKWKKWSGDMVDRSSRRDGAVVAVAAAIINNNISSI